MRLLLLFVKSCGTLTLILEAHKTLKQPATRQRRAKVAATVSSTKDRARQRELKQTLKVFLLWFALLKCEPLIAPFGWVLPFFDEIKLSLLLWFLVSRSMVAAQLYAATIERILRPYESILDFAIDLLGVLLALIPRAIAWLLEMIGIKKMPVEVKKKSSEPAEESAPRRPLRARPSGAPAYFPGTIPLTPAPRPSDLLRPASPHAIHFGPDQLARTPHFPAVPTHSPANTPPLQPSPPNLQSYLPPLPPVASNPLMSPRTSPPRTRQSSKKAVKPSTVKTKSPSKARSTASKTLKAPIKSSSKPAVAKDSVKLRVVRSKTKVPVAKAMDVDRELQEEVRDLNGKGKVTDGPDSDELQVKKRKAEPEPEGSAKKRKVLKKDEKVEPKTRLPRAASRKVVGSTAIGKIGEEVTRTTRATRAKYIDAGKDKAKDGKSNGA